MRYLHLIDQHGLSTHRLRGAKIEHVQDFANDDAELALQRFTHWLAQARRGIHTILIDLPDEGFHVEQIPPVSGADRKALLARRQVQMFMGTPYATAIPLGYDTEGRRDERVLLAALTQPAALDPWLEVLRQGQARLSGIYSVPLLTQPLLDALRPNPPQGILLSLSASGIRQTYFEGGTLRFSRLSPPAEGPMSGWADACLREAQKTAQYLIAQRWITREVQLPVWLLVQRDDFAALVQDESGATLQSQQLNFRLASLESLAQHTGCRAQPGNSDSMPLLMYLALHARGKHQFAPQADLRIFRLWRLRNAIASLGVCAALVFAVLIAKDMRQIDQLTQRSQQLQSDIAHHNGAYERLLASMPKLPTALDTLQAIVTTQVQLATRQIHPEQDLRKLSRAFDRYPDVSLLSLAWQQKKPSATGLPSLRSDWTITAALPPSINEPREAIRRIRAFADEVRTQTGGEITALKLPFDVDPDKTLRSEADQGVAQARFQIRLTTGSSAP